MREAKQTLKAYEMNKKTRTKIKIISISLGAIWGIGSLYIISPTLGQTAVHPIWLLVFSPQLIAVTLITIGNVLGGQGPFFGLVSYFLISVGSPLIGVLIGWLIGKVIIWTIAIRNKRNTLQD